MSGILFNYKLTQQKIFFGIKTQNFQAKLDSTLQQKLNIWVVTALKRSWMMLLIKNLKLLRRKWLIVDYKGQVSLK